MEIPIEDIYNLDVTLGAFLLPRLKMFKTGDYGIPGNLTEEEWIAVLDELIALAEFLANEGLINILEDSPTYVTYQKRMQHLTKHLPNLWT